MISHQRLSALQSKEPAFFKSAFVHQLTGRSGRGGVICMGACGCISCVPLLCRLDVAACVLNWTGSCQTHISYRHTCTSSLSAVRAQHEGVDRRAQHQDALLLEEQVGKISRFCGFDRRQQVRSGAMEARKMKDVKKKEDLIRDTSGCRLPTLFWRGRNLLRCHHSSSACRKCLGTAHDTSFLHPPSSLAHIRPSHSRRHIFIVTEGSE